MAPVLCHTRGARGQLLRTGACPFVLHQQLIASSIGGGVQLLSLLLSSPADDSGHGAGPDAEASVPQ